MNSGRRTLCFQICPHGNKRNQSQNCGPNSQLRLPCGVSNRPGRKECCPPEPAQEKKEKKCGHFQKKMSKKLSKTRLELVFFRLLVKSSTIKLPALSEEKKISVRRKNRTFISSLGSFCSATELYAQGKCRKGELNS